MTDIVDPVLEKYAEDHTTPPPPHLVAVDRETRQELDFPGMMVGTLEGRFLEMLVFALRPRRVLEIGTFSGYSSLAMAAALAPGGLITTCELSPVHAEAARRHIAASPYADRIEVIEGPAIDTVRSLPGPFDFVFIDADKGSYLAYYEAVLPKLASGGLIAADNTLWSGNVVNDGDRSPDTQAIRAFNDAVAADGRVVCVQLTVRDGVTLIRRAADTGAGTAASGE
ncbi:MAG TPA: class I SAM-dependent methyltransferase [Acidimicrobiales bacterium]|nr:class I SAM-dependent methyltransferase [Acidimicrobiales bacterium]